MHTISQEAETEIYVGLVESYMKRVINDYIDPLTGEVNLTKLAEDAISHFDAGFDEEVNEGCFEISFKVADDMGLI